MVTNGEILALHLADTHLGRRQYGLEEREKDFYDTFMEAISIAIREHVDLVIHGGDFFDTYRPPPQAFLVAINGLRKLKEHGIPAVTVLGEHDTPKRRSFPAPLLLQELGLIRVLGYNPAREETLYTTLRTRKGDVFLAGLSNHRQASEVRILPDRLRALKTPPPDKPSILLLHQALQELVPGGEISVKDLPPGYNYYALGHIHSAKIYQKGNILLAYPGSTEVFGKDELASDNGRKYVLLVAIRRREAEIIDKVRLEKVRPQAIIRTTYENLKKSLAEFVYKNRGGGKKPILFLHVSKVPLHVKRRQLYLIAETILRNHVLYYRFEEILAEEDGNEEALPAPSGSIDLERIAEAVLRDKERAELLVRLISLLGYGGSSSDMEEAMRVVKEYALRRYGVEL